LLREGQIFFVHNRVSDIDQAAKRLGQLVPDARIAIAHGQMDEGTLERVMIDFWQRRYDVFGVHDDRRVGHRPALGEHAHRGPI